MDEKYYEKMYQANVKLVDENSTLKEYTKSLERRIDKALSKLEEIVLYDEYVTIHSDFINDTKEILKGDSYEQDNS